MKLYKEKIEILRNLRKILEEEKSRVLREMFSRDSFTGEVLEETRSVSVVAFERKVNPGTYLGYREGEDILPFGYVIESLSSFSKGKSTCIVKKVTRDNPEEFLEIDNLAIYDVQIDAIDSFNFDFKIKDINKNFKKVEGLDEWQSLACSSSVSLENGEILVVLGPPGTGKTRFIRKSAEIVCDKGRVLVTSHTNRAVDNVVEGLNTKNKGDVVRIGHPSKISENAKKYSLESIIYKKLKNLSVEEIVGKLRELNKEMNKLIANAKVVGATLMKCALSNTLLDFDWVFIDEASQALVSEALIGVNVGKKVVIVGDPYQLPPIIRGCYNSSAYSAFAFFSFPGKEKLWLRRHYRSNRSIIEFVSKYVYGGMIEPARICDGIKLKLKRPPKKFEEILNPEKPVVFVSVNGFEEYKGKSKYNIKEAILAFEICKELISCGIDYLDIGVITPYVAQKEILRDVFGSIDVEVDTVDAFQGREKDVIVFSTVSTSSLNFPSDRKRFNVSVTRAKKKFIVLANSKVFLKNSNKNTLLYKFYRYALERNSAIRLKDF